MSKYPLPDTSTDLFSFADVDLKVALEDLASRFVINIPPFERATIERIGFQVEASHWYYEDFVREENPTFPTCSLKRFYALLWNAVPLCREWHPSHEEAFERFMLYKQYVPVCGAILVNESCDQVVLVKGWKNSAGWGFPKGKINLNEPTIKCAVREVLEETSYDTRQLINEDDKIEMQILNQEVTLYIIWPVPEDAALAPRTRKEISKIGWFPVTELPGWLGSQHVTTSKFFHVYPFINPLRRWIQRKKRSLQLEAYDHSVVHGVAHEGGSQPRPKKAKKSKKNKSTAGQAQQPPIKVADPTAITHVDASDYTTEEEGDLSITQDEGSDGELNALAYLQAHIKTNSSDTRASIPIRDDGNPTTVNVSITGQKTDISFNVGHSKRSSIHSTSSQASPPNEFLTPSEMIRRHSGLATSGSSGLTTASRTYSPHSHVEGTQEAAQRAKNLLDSLTGDSGARTNTSLVDNFSTQTPPRYTSSPPPSSYHSAGPFNTVHGMAPSRPDGVAGMYSSGSSTHNLVQPVLAASHPSSGPFPTRSGSTIVPHPIHMGPEQYGTARFNSLNPGYGPSDTGMTFSSANYPPMPPLHSHPLDRIPHHLAMQHRFAGGVVPSPPTRNNSLGDNERTPRASILQPSSLSITPIGYGSHPVLSQPRHVPHASALLALFSKPASSTPESPAAESSAWSG